MNWKDKEAVREYMREYKRTHNTNKKYYETHKEEKLRKDKEYREKNKDKLSAYYKEYRLDNAEKIKKYKDSHKEDTKEYNRQYYLNHKDELIQKKTEYLKAYKKTPMGRAVKLVQSYKRMDKEAKRGECTLTAKWIVENIFSKPCAHCDKSGWQVIGCNRLDNSRPHTEDNVEPCCFHCNCVLNGKETSLRKLQKRR